MNDKDWSIRGRSHGSIPPHPGWLVQWSFPPPCLGVGQEDVLLRGCLESGGRGLAAVSWQAALCWLVLHDSWDTTTVVWTEKAVNKKIYLSMFSIVWDKLYVFVSAQEDNICLLWAGKDWLGDSDLPESWSSDLRQWWMTKCLGERDEDRIEFHSIPYLLRYYHRYILHHRNCLKRRIRILHWMPTPRKCRMPSQRSNPLKLIHQHLDSKRSERSRCKFFEIFK